jgi:hypothetical protein
METVEVLPQKKYRPKEMRYLLSRFRGSSVGLSTWGFWKKNFQIRPDGDGYYWQEDLDLLKGWIAAKRSGYTINQYKQYLERVKEQVKNAHQI